MTPECLEQLRELRKDERFSDLTIEQLLWEAVRSADCEEVQLILDDLETELSGELPQWAVEDLSAIGPRHGVPPSDSWRDRARESG